jgi:UDP-N-acetylmuramoyl-tripeptide--D-alanyl-D-alanine ligase
MKYAVVALFYALMCMYALHYYTMLQLNNYKIKQSYSNEQFFLLNTLGLLLGAIVFVLLASIFDSLTNQIIMAAAFAALFVWYLMLYIRKRSKFVFTARGKRLCAAFAALCAPMWAVLLAKEQYTYTAAVWLALIFCPFFCYAAFMILKPFETLNNKKYVENARKILRQNKTLTRIGITGSFGKTSCKNILNEMLSKMYNVSATKASYNTPLGIASAVNDINGATDIFIAEMGARKTGDIKELAEIVRPTYAIITGVTRQHMETFKTLQNIYQEKQELVNAIPETGFCVFNGENCYAKHMYYKCRTKKCIVGFDSSYDIFADNIKTASDGSSFEIVYQSKRLECQTKLLGKHNILNILLSFAVAKQFFVSDEQLQQTIAALQPVSHRMEIIQANGISIIDDSYNCNIEGAAAALEALKDFDGRKVVFSQGIVETDKDDINIFLGRLIAKIADIVILCGSNQQAIKSGLVSGGFEGEVHMFKDLRTVQKNFRSILRKGDVLLIQNDLPDGY